MKGPDGPSVWPNITAWTRTPRRRVLLDDGSDSFDDEIPEGRHVREGDEARSTDEEVPILYWSVINAIEELEPKQAMDGRYIPIIPVVGRELIPFESRAALGRHDRAE
jgi:hypothetical protein